MGTFAFRRLLAASQLVESIVFSVGPYELYKLAVNFNRNSFTIFTVSISPPDTTCFKEDNFSNIFLSAISTSSPSTTGGMLILVILLLSTKRMMLLRRSEERRVGKECRCRW